jgi:thiamine phosphate synthase YjbQ (UPF0047 family)
MAHASGINFLVRECHLRGLLIQWSVKVEFCRADTTFGMWQLVQFFVLTGQAAPA